MTTTQISKIQLRRGPEADLPGQPVSVIPAVLGTPLSTGELAFTTDTGRVFVGPDLTAAGATINRTSFPYQNIEVLTEAATDTLQGIFDGFASRMRTAYIKSDAMLSNSSTDSTDWGTITAVSGSGGVSVPFPVSISASLCAASLPYVVFDGTEFIRQGTLRVMYAPGYAAPMLTDDAISARVINPAGQDAVSTYGTLAFRAAQYTDSSGTYVVIQYRNLTGTTPVLLFRLEAPQVS